MATVTGLKNPSALGPLTKEHYIVRRETKGYYYSSGKLVYDKIQAGTEVTAIDTVATMSDGVDRKLNSMTVDGKSCSTVMIGDLDPIQINSSRRIYVIADSDMIWDGTGGAQSLVDYSFRLTTESQTTPSQQSTSSTTKSTTSPTDYPMQDTTAYKMYVTASSLNVRDEASSSSEKIGSLSNGDEVSVSNYNPEKLGEWTRIIYKGSPAYVSTQYLSKTKPSTAISKSNTQNTSTSYSSEDKTDSGEGFFTPAIIISGVIATGLLMYALFGGNNDNDE